MPTRRTYDMDERYPAWAMLGGLGLSGSVMWLIGRPLFPALAAWWAGEPLPDNGDPFVMAFTLAWFLLSLCFFQGCVLELICPFSGRDGRHPISILCALLFFGYVICLPLGWGSRDLYRSYRVETEGLRLTAQIQYYEKTATCTLPGQAKPLRVNFCPLWWDDDLRRHRLVELTVACLPEQPEWSYVSGVGMRIFWWLPGAASCAVGLFWLAAIYHYTLPWLGWQLPTRRRSSSRPKRKLSLPS